MSPASQVPGKKMNGVVHDDPDGNGSYYGCAEPNFADEISPQTECHEHRYEIRDQADEADADIPENQHQNKTNNGCGENCTGQHADDVPVRHASADHGETGCRARQFGGIGLQPVPRTPIDSYMVPRRGVFKHHGHSGGGFGEVHAISEIGAKGKR